MTATSAGAEPLAPSAAAAHALDVTPRLDGLRFDYEPFPIGVAADVFAPETYAEMVRCFPTAEDFVAKRTIGVKYSLSQVNNRAAYRRVIDRHPIWRRFHAAVKHPDFIRHVLAALGRHGIDLSLYEQPWRERLRQRLRALKRGRPQPHMPRLSARFEFSAMPVAGGSIRPHTDDPAKLVTLVVSMLAPGEWDPAWGGGTSVVWPLDPARSFNPGNHYLEFADVRTLRTFPFLPNQCVVFVKTPSSWHMVAPMTGSDPARLRRTLTINIETT